MRVAIMSLLVVISVAGCDSISVEMSRSKAGDLVRAALAEDRNDRFYYCVDEETMSRELHARGYVDEYLKVTDAGKALGIEGESFRFGILRLSQNASVELAEITGIVDSSSPQHKQVEFDWKYVGVPSELSDLHAAGGKGTLQVAGYDDGWRVQDMQGGRSALKLHLDERQCMQPGK